MQSTKILYLDQNAIIWLADRRLPKASAKASIDLLNTSLIEAVARRSCVIPFSPLHLQETRNAEPESREKICQVFDQLSGGYQFLDEAVILSQQAKAIFQDRKPTFKRKDAVAKTGYSFRSLLPGTSLKEISNDAYGDVTKRWAMMTRREIASLVKEEEAASIARLVERLMGRVLYDKAENPWEFLALPNALFTDLCEVASRAGQRNPQVAALEFLRTRILELPGVLIQCEMLAKEAACYAKDNPRPRSASKPFSNYACDIEMASTYVPYCDAVLTERGRADSMRQCKHLFPRLPHIFTAETLDDFYKWVSDLPAPAYEKHSVADWLLHFSTLPKQRIGVGIHPRSPDFLIDEGNDSWFEERFIVRELGGCGIFVATGLDENKTQPDEVEEALDHMLDFWGRICSAKPGDLQLEVVLDRSGVGCRVAHAFMPFGYKELLKPNLSEIVKSIFSD